MFAVWGRICQLLQMQTRCWEQQSLGFTRLSVRHSCFYNHNFFCGHQRLCPQTASSEQEKNLPQDRRKPSLILPSPHKINASLNKPVLKRRYAQRHLNSSPNCSRLFLRWRNFYVIWTWTDSDARKSSKGTATERCLYCMCTLSVEISPISLFALWRFCALSSTPAAKLKKQPSQVDDGQKN